MSLREGNKAISFHLVVSTAASVHERNEDSAARLIFTVIFFPAIMSNVSNSYYILSRFSLKFLLRQHNFCVLV